MKTAFIQALKKRRRLADGSNMLRLVNGFAEISGKMTVELFAHTAVISDHSETGEFFHSSSELSSLIREIYPEVTAVVAKWRNSPVRRECRGVLIHGSVTDDEITEHGVKYPVNLMLNQDNSFYGDTRNLRRFLLENSSGRRVLNTFAYTGSLGVAALAGGAEMVVQCDLSAKFMSMALTGCRLNGLDEKQMQLIEGNFFPVVSGLKKAGALFDTVILDPPYFSSTPKGTVDMLKHPVALVNKVRPLLADGGIIVLVNNALYLSGAEFIAAADALCDGHYLCREAMIDIPEDFAVSGRLPGVADPSPFNHSTKIVTFRVRRRDERG